MGQLRIRGLVKLCTAVRRELTAPVAPTRRDELQQMAAQAIETVDQLLADHGTSLSTLPAPSQRAYRFLANVDFDAVAVSESAPTDGPAPSSVRFIGLRKHVETLLESLARADGTDVDEIHDGIIEASENIERHIVAHAWRPIHLKDETRSLRGWLAFWAQPENFEMYLAALARARPLLEDAVQRSGQRHLPVLIHFRPMIAIYRIRSYHTKTRMLLPTPMVSFSPEAFAQLAETALCGGRNEQRVLDEIAGEAYQTIRAELEALGGVVERTAGVTHDLAVAFDRVNATYFGRQMDRPHLTWSSTFTGRKFGHYDAARDTLMVSASLDDKNVPAYVVDFLVYHELLHKKHGIRWRNGRMTAHTREFRRDERRFKQVTEAETLLHKLTVATLRSERPGGRSPS